MRYFEGTILDVDERIDPSSVDYLKDVLESNKDYMAFRLPRYDYIGGGKYYRYNV